MRATEDGATIDMPPDLPPAKATMLFEHVRPVASGPVVLPVLLIKVDCSPQSLLQIHGHLPPRSIVKA